MLYKLLFLIISMVLWSGCARFALNDAKEINSVKAYDEFIKKYSDDYELVKEATTLREEALYREIVKKKSIELCELYISDYFKGKYINDVLRLLEQYRYIDAKKKNRLYLYEKYLVDYPNGKFVREVTRLREPLFYTKAIKKNHLDLYNEYLEKYPNGKYVPEISSLRERAFYEYALKQDKLSEYAEYLKKYPNGKYFQEISVHHEGLLYKYAVDRNQIYLYDEYLSTYPNGKFIQDIAKLREKTLFEKAKEENNLDVYNQYLTEYSQGIYYAEVLSLREDFLYQLIKQTNQLQNFITYFKLYKNGRYLPQLLQNIAYNLQTDINFDKNVNVYKNIAKYFKDYGVFFALHKKTGDMKYLDTANQYAKTVGEKAQVEEIILKKYHDKIFDINLNVRKGEFKTWTEKLLFISATFSEQEFFLDYTIQPKKNAPGLPEYGTFLIELEIEIIKQYDYDAANGHAKPKDSVKLSKTYKLLPPSYRIEKTVSQKIRSSESSSVVGLPILAKELEDIKVTSKISSIKLLNEEKYFTQAIYKKEKKPISSQNNKKKMVSFKNITFGSKEIIINTTDKIKKDFFLAEPDRLVMDFYSNKKVDFTSQQFKHDLLNKIVIAGKSGWYRMVFHVKKPIKYNVHKSDSSYKVEVF